MKTQMTQKIFTRDFILVFLAQFTLQFVFNILIPTLPIYLSRLGESEVETGILIGIFFFSSLVFRPFVGKALLKIPEKTFMITGALLYSFTSFAFILTPPFWPFLIVRFIQGIGFALFHTSSYTLVANISPEARRGQVLSYFLLAGNLSGALAPPIGIFLIEYFSFTSLFLVCLGLSLCSLFIAMRLKERKVIPSKDSSGGGAFFISREALSPSVIHAIALFIWGALTAFFPLYSIHQGVANPGLFFTTIAVMLFLGRALGGKIVDFYSKESIILPCLSTYIISMVLLAFSKSQAMFILVAVIWGIGHAFFSPAIMAHILDRVGSPGPAMGTLTAVTDLGISLGPVVMGIVLHSTSYPTMFLCLAFIGIINLNCFYFFVRNKGERGT
jgi:MFS family permease